MTTRTQATNTIINDQFWLTLKEPKFKFYKLDLNSQNVKTSYAGLLRMNGGQPAIGIFNADTMEWLNKNPADTKLPATREGVRALILKYGGQL